jgi:WD40 repeat protein/CHAT domain-containing protein/tetratricopeptide (TPR) repeat protein
MYSAIRSKADTVWQSRGIAGPAWGVLLALLVVAWWQPAWLCAEPPSLHDASRRLQDLAERDDFARQARQLRGAGKLTEASAAGEKALARTRRLEGDLHANVASWLQFLAELHEQQAHFKAARAAREESLAIQEKNYGEQDWRTTDTRLALAHLGRLEKLSPEQLHRLADADKLADEAVALGNRGKYAEGIAPALKAEEARKELLGIDDSQTLSALSNLGWLYRESGDYGHAEPVLDQNLKGSARVLGTSHPRYALSLNNRGWLHVYRQEYPQAERCFREAAAVYKQEYGNRHLDYAASVANLGALFRQTREYDKAEPLLKEVIDVRKQVVGEYDARFALALRELGRLYESTSEFSRAETQFRQSLDIYRQALGEHAETATALIWLGSLYVETGAYDRAVPLLQEAVAMRKKVLTEKHPHYGGALYQLALLYRAMGDYASAERSHREALAVCRAALGEDNAFTVQVWNGLGVLYRYEGDYPRAKEIMRRTFALKKKTAHERPIDYAQEAHALGLLLQAMGEYMEAETLLRESRDVLRKELGADHLLYVRALRELAGLYHRMGDYDQAEPLFLEALDYYRRRMGEGHPDTISVVAGLARLYRDRGQYGKAEPLAWLALQAARELLSTTASVESERQQLASLALLRERLDLYLSLAGPAGLLGETIYAPVLAWKGSTFLRQERLRADRADPEGAPLRAELRSASARLASLALAGPAPGAVDAWKRQQEEMQTKIEELEAQLAGRSAIFRQKQARNSIGPSRLKAALPLDTALVDLLVYDIDRPDPHARGKWGSDRRLAAFVVRADKPVRYLDLGPLAPITGAIERWRGTLKRGRPVQGDDDPAADLRRRLWQPLEEAIAGARTVLISPDGSLARLPFAALPGKQPDHYLIEEVSVALLPVPAMLPSLRSGSGPLAPSGLFLVGDVDFDAGPGPAHTQDTLAMSSRGTRAGGPLRWDRLKGTRGEVEAIEQLFKKVPSHGKLTVLCGADATEGAVGRRAPGHRYLHFATHGFFASSAGASMPAWMEDASQEHPGLLSGLVLAGANRPSESGLDNGILTALEVAGLDLRGVNLAVLSACETGLGKEAGGEGVLGLQRSFAVAGARSVVASLWQVPDEPTRVLMAHMYANLWQNKMTKLEALRAAQLWMLREGRRDEGVKRGMRREDEKEVSSEAGRLPPFYWAAFSLSGEWLQAPAEVPVAEGLPDQPALVAQLGPPYTPNLLAASRDGKQVMTVFGRFLHLWDTETGRLLRTFRHTSSSTVTALAFSPDGKRFLTAGGSDTRAYLRDLDTGKEVRLFPGHTGALQAVAFTPDGAALITGSVDRMLCLWETSTGRLLRQFTGHVGGIHAVAVSGDGAVLASGAADGTARLWDAASGKQVRCLGAIGGKWITSVALSRDGKLLATSTVEGVVLWDTGNGTALRQIPESGALAFSPDSKKLVVASGGGAACVYEVPTGAELRHLGAGQPSSRAVSFSPDGRMVYTLSGRMSREDPFITLWDVESGAAVRTLGDRTDPLTSLAVSQDSALLAVGSFSGVIHLWDLRLGAEVRRLTGHRERVSSVAFSPTNRFVLTASFDKTARIWGVVTGLELRQFSAVGPVKRAVFTQDGRAVLTAEATTGVLWDVKTATRERSFPVDGGTEGVVSMAVLSPDGNEVLTNGRTACLRATGSGQVMQRLDRQIPALGFLTFAPDGKSVAGPGLRDTVGVWDALTGYPIRRFAGHTSMVSSICFSADGRQLLSGCDDNTARLWDVSSGEELQCFEGHTGWVNAVVLSPDAKLAFTAGEDGTVRLWSAATGKELGRLISFADGTWAVLDPEGHYDASHGGDIAHLHFVCGKETVDGKALKDRSHEPGLLPRLLGVRKEPLRHDE